MRPRFQCAVDDVVARSTPKHQQIEQGIGAKAIGAVHTDAGTFPHGVKAVDDVVGLAVLWRHDLTMDVRRNAAHLVMDGGHHRDRLPGDIDIGEVVPDLVDRGQPLHDGLGAEVSHVEHHVVLVRTAATAFLDLLVHAARNEIPRCQILQRRRIALHETFAIGIAQDRTFAAAAFGQQYTSAGNASRVELPEFHVLKRNAGSSGHAQPVTGVDEGIGGRREDAPRAARGHQRDLRFEDVHLAGFHLQRRHADHIAFGITDQVERHPFDEEIGARLDVLLIQRVQHRVACAVGRGAGALHRLFTVVGGVTAEGALVDRAVRVAVKGHAEMFELVNDLRRLAAHELDGVLVAQPVAALDGVVEVVVPVVLGHVAQARTDTALRSHGVRARREHLRQHRDIQAGARELQRRPHAGAAGADDHHIELALRNRRTQRTHCRRTNLHHSLHSTWIAQPAHPTNQAMVNTCKARRIPTGLT